MVRGCAHPRHAGQRVSQRARGGACTPPCQCLPDQHSPDQHSPDRAHQLPGCAHTPTGTHLLVHLMAPPGTPAPTPVNACPPPRATPTPVPTAPLPLLHPCSYCTTALLHPTTHGTTAFLPSGTPHTRNTTTTHTRHGVHPHLDNHTPQHPQKPPPPTTLQYRRHPGSLLSSKGL